jgi:hypothetical protein
MMASWEHWWKLRIKDGFLGTLVGVESGLIAPTYPTVAVGLEMDGSGRTSMIYSFRRTAWRGKVAGLSSCVPSSLFFLIIRSDRPNNYTDPAFCLFLGGIV